MNFNSIPFLFLNVKLVWSTAVNFLHTVFPEFFNLGYSFSTGYMFQLLSRVPGIVRIARIVPVRIVPNEILCC
jgi:hypothetical protein